MPFGLTFAALLLRQRGEADDPEGALARSEAARPFEDERGAGGGKLQIALLEKIATAAAIKKVHALSTDDDRLLVEGRELYWLPVGGVSESDLDFKTIERALGPMTVRTQGTFARLAKKL